MPVVRTLVAIGIAFSVASCAGLPRTAFDTSEQAVAEIPGMSNVRFFADAPIEQIYRVLDPDPMFVAAGKNGRFDMLAVSGGAWDGAYGAGLLTGWSRAGGRPKFSVVTGVSAGSLIAPLAFLGPDYDTQLEDAFTGGVAETLGDGSEGLLSILFERDSRRATLKAMVMCYVDEALLRAVAAEHRRGRRLLVVTTNLDAQRAVVWNMGAIAASGAPHALDLFRDVLIASSSVPGAFEPTRISVTANGRAFAEMHVDGGVTMNVFTMPDALLLNGNAGRQRVPGRIYVIINNRLAPEFEVVDADVPGQLGRTVSTLLKAHTRSEILAMIGFARSDGMDFNLAYVNEDLPKDLKPGFNAKYMRAVYALAHERSLAGDFWKKTLALPGTPQ